VVLGSAFGTNNEEGTEDCRNCVMRDFVICICHHIPFGCQTKDDEMEGTCGTYGAEDKNICVHDFGTEI